VGVYLADKEAVMSANASWFGSIPFHRYQAILVAVCLACIGLAAQIAAASSLLGSPTEVVTLVVDTTIDSNEDIYRACTEAPNDCSLRGAISESNWHAYAPYEIILPPGTYQSTLWPNWDNDNNGGGDFDAAGILTITGSSITDTFILYSAYDDPILQALPGSNILIQNVTLRGYETWGWGSRGLYVEEGSSLHLKNTVLRNFHSDGGHAIINEGSVTISHSSILTNTAGDIWHEGAIWNRGEATTLTIADSVFYNNSGEHGAVIFSEIGTVNISNTIISGNWGIEAGYTTGVVTVRNGKATLFRTTIANNGGELTYGVVAPDLTVIDSAITGNDSNHAVTVGGCQLLYMANSVVSNNTGVGVSGCNLAIFNSQITGNGAWGLGGGGIIQDSNVMGNDQGGVDAGGLITISRSTIAGNAGWGGIRFFGSTLNLSDSTIVGNSGGRGLTINGVANIVNSTISGNTAGGVFLYTNSTAHLSNVTIAQNEAPSGSGIFGSTDTEETPYLAMQNSIVTGNSGEACGGSFMSSGTNNLIDDTSCGSDPIFRPGAVTGFDPALRNNGGPTWTHALLVGSNAIDAAADCTVIDSSTAPMPYQGGAPLLRDQRGFLRPQGAACDIGAFEVGRTFLLAFVQQ
jgi:hypothetical protein